MRELNIVPRFGGRLMPAPRAACREIRFGGKRIFLDPATLAVWAAEKPWERAPLTGGHEPEFAPPRHARLSAVCLSVTHGCNLACRYCYVRKAHSSGSGGGGAAPGMSSVMTRDVARRAISLLEGPGPWRVGFFGGEPTLAWDTITAGVALARERATRVGARVRFSLTTNGTLLTPERARYLATHGFSVIFSLDGPRELHDRERRFAGDLSDGLKGDRAGSYDRAREGLGILADAGLGSRVTLRATFPLKRPELRARLEHLNALADDGLAGAVSVEPAWPGRHEASDMTSLEREYLDAARWAEGRLAAGARLRFHHLTKALERILLRRPAGSECGAGFGYVEVAPSGDIHACHKGIGGAIGHVETGISERLRAPWRENRWYGREGCGRCWARNVCGGGCRAESLEHELSTARPWAVACRAKRLQVRAALHVAATADADALRRLLRVKPPAPRKATSTSASATEGTEITEGTSR